MASTIPVGFGVAAMHFSVSGKPDDMIATIGYTYSTGQNPSGHANDIYAALTDATGPFRPGSYNVTTFFLGVSTTEMSPTGPVVGAHMESHAGLQNAATPPVNVCLLIKKETGRGGRHGRGRMYLPCIALDSAQITSAGSVAAGIVADQEMRWNAARTAVETAGVPFQLLHADGSDGDPILHFSVSNTVATQRRRVR